MIFKAKKKQRQIILIKLWPKKEPPRTHQMSVLEIYNRKIGDDMGITFNWPYDFFSLVELVKLDAEVNLGNLPPPVDEQ